MCTLFSLTPRFPRHTWHVFYLHRSLPPPHSLSRTRVRGAYLCLQTATPYPPSCSSWARAVARWCCRLPSSCWRLSWPCVFCPRRGECSPWTWCCPSSASSPAVSPAVRILGVHEILVVFPTPSRLITKPQTIETEHAHRSSLSYG